MVVSEKNVYVLSGGHQFIADVERKSNLSNSETTVSRNLWNLYTEDGKILCNIFDSSNFSIRSQLTTGSSNVSKSSVGCHDRMFMPNCGGYIGQCQMYDNAYSITEKTVEAFKSEYRMDVNGNYGTYSFDCGFCRYLPISAYSDSYFTYINPSDIYTPTDGVTYLLEYPLNEFYSDFGTDYLNGSPTIFADAVTTKYYLNHCFSVEGVATVGSDIRVRKMRDYLGVGNTANSVYLTFRNNRIGTYDESEWSSENQDGTQSEEQSAGQTADQTEGQTEIEFSYCAKDITTLGCMDNIVICPFSVNGFAFSSSFNSVFSSGGEFDLYDAVKSVQPHDNSFVLYLIADGKYAKKLVYIPKVGNIAQHDEWTFENDEDVVGVDFVETDSSVMMVSKRNGVLNIFSKSHYCQFGMTDERACPFDRPKFGYPGINLTDIFNGCIDYSAFYSGDGIVGVKCRKSTGSDGCMAFVTKGFSTDEREYEIGEYFQMLLCNKGEMFERIFHNAEVVESETYRFNFNRKANEIASCSFVVDNGQTQTFNSKYVDGDVTVKKPFFDSLTVTSNISSGSPFFTYDSDTVAISLTSTGTLKPVLRTYNTSITCTPSFKVTSTLKPQYVVSDVLFDYLSTSANGLTVGEYVFVQFSDGGLKMAHVDSLMSRCGYSLMSDTGPINASVADGELCIDVKFAMVNFDEAVKNSAISLSKYIKSDFNSRYVTVKPFLRTVYSKTEDGKIVGYEQSFSVFPSNSDREIICESVNGGTVMKDVEQMPISSWDFAFEQYVPQSMGVAVKSINSETSKHDAAISLVHWNDDDGVFHTDSDYRDLSQSIGGLYLQYNAICTDVAINAYYGKANKLNEKYYGNCVSTVSEYPHPCFGDLVTAGTGLKIFDGPLSKNMTVGDVFALNGYVIVKNYEIDAVEAKPLGAYAENVVKTGKTHVGGVSPLLHGGYVVTNFFCDDNSRDTVKGLYKVENVVDKNSIIKGAYVRLGSNGTLRRKQDINNYNGLWHIRPGKNIEFYPKSEVGKVWKPYYVNKYVDFIEYHNGYYYICLKSTKINDDNTIGYDIVETDDLFSEKSTVALSAHMVVSGIRFFDEDVVVEYSEIIDGALQKSAIKTFKYGKSDTKFKVFGVPAEKESGEDDSDVDESGVVNANAVSERHPFSTRHSIVSDGVAEYDNVEVLYSMNRFTPVNSHKANMFSIKIEDLGLDESPFLSDSQKNSVRTWLKNKVIDIVDEIKPAHTEIFDVYVS